jgi:hypothetical protein
MGNTGSNSSQEMIMGNLKRDELLMSGYVLLNRSTFFCF